MVPIKRRQEGRCELQLNEKELRIEYVFIPFNNNNIAVEHQQAINCVVDFFADYDQWDMVKVIKEEIPVKLTPHMNIIDTELIKIFPNIMENTNNQSAGVDLQVTYYFNKEQNTDFLRLNFDKFGTIILTNGELYDNIPVIFIARREGEQDLYFGLLIDMNTTLLQWMLALLNEDLQKKIFTEGLTLEKIISESPQIFILTLTIDSSSVIEVQDKTILKQLL